ncbi:uncharacterized protein [Littorina saxatilis]|uniref:Uncharacterized protein n=1 Tax=Littorina saxatilis TaxID=31220 RepID=A0AAN9G9L3_9CAEN
MSMDYRKNTYRPDRPDTRLKTTYGCMSEWVRGPGGARAGRPGFPAALIAQNNSSPKFTKKKPRRGEQQYCYMRHGLAASDPRFDARRAALDESLPVHSRFTDDGGYDDFHKAYRAAKRVGPADDFPLWGPPRLRHGRQGGSWRHVKEVLQAGGNRIVFVDGQVSVKDTQEIEDVPGGQLILSHIKGPQLSRDLDHMLDLQPTPRLRLLARGQSLNGPMRGAPTAQQGFEKHNWSIIR